MLSARNEFYSNVQIARKRIFKRYLIWILCFLLDCCVVSWRGRPFPDYIFFAILFPCGAVLLWSPIRRLQKMPCPYCHYPARVSILPLRHFRCMHCHKSIGDSIEAIQRG